MESEPVHEARACLGRLHSEKVFCAQQRTRRLALPWAVFADRAVVQCGAPCRGQLRTVNCGQAPLTRPWDMRLHVAAGEELSPPKGPQTLG